NQAEAEHHRQQRRHVEPDARQAEEDNEQQHQHRYAAQHINHSREQRRQPDAAEFARDRDAKTDDERGRGARQSDQQRVTGALEQGQQNPGERHAALSRAHFIHLSIIAWRFCGPSSSRYLSKSTRSADPLGKAKPSLSMPAKTYVSWIGSFLR